MSTVEDRYRLVGQNWSRYSTVAGMFGERSRLEVSLSTCPNLRLKLIYSGINFHLKERTGMLRTFLWKLTASWHVIPCFDVRFVDADITVTEALLNTD